MSEIPEATSTPLENLTVAKPEADIVTPEEQNDPHSTADGNVHDSMFHTLMELGIHSKNDAKLVVSHLIERGFGFRHENVPSLPPVTPMPEDSGPR